MLSDVQRSIFIQSFISSFGYAYCQRKWVPNYILLIFLCQTAGNISDMCAMCNVDFLVESICWYCDSVIAFIAKYDLAQTDLV